MCRYTDVEFVLISPKELAVPDYIKTDVLDASGMKYTEVEHMEDVMPRLDVLYMTRIQRERFFRKTSTCVIRTPLYWTRRSWKVQKAI